MLEVNIFKPDGVLKAELKLMIGILVGIRAMFEFAEMQDQRDNIDI